MSQPLSGSDELSRITEVFERRHEQLVSARDPTVLLQYSLLPYVSCIQETIGGTEESVFENAKMCRSLHVMQVLEKQLLLCYKSSKSILGSLEKHVQQIKTNDVNTKLRLLNMISTDLKKNQMIGDRYNDIIQKQTATIDAVKKSIEGRKPATIPEESSSSTDVLHDSHELDDTEHERHFDSQGRRLTSQDAASNIDMEHTSDDIASDNHEFFDAHSDHAVQSAAPIVVKGVSQSLPNRHESASNVNGLQFSPEESETRYTHPWRQELERMIDSKPSDDAPMRTGALPNSNMNGNGMKELEDEMSSSEYEDSSDEEVEFRSPEEADVYNSSKPWRRHSPVFEDSSSDEDEPEFPSQQENTYLQTTFFPNLGATSQIKKAEEVDTGGAKPAHPTPLEAVINSQSAPSEEHRSVKSNMQGNGIAKDCAESVDSSEVSVVLEKAQSLAESLKVGSTGSWEIDGGRKARDTDNPVSARPNLSRVKNLYSSQSMLDLIERQEWRPVCSADFSDRLNTSRQRLVERSTVSLPSMNRGRRVKPSRVRKEGLNDTASLPSGRKQRRPSSEQRTHSKNQSSDRIADKKRRSAASSSSGDPSGRKTVSSIFSGKRTNATIEKSPEWVVDRDKKEMKILRSMMRRKGQAAGRPASQYKKNHHHHDSAVHSK